MKILLSFKGEASSSQFYKSKTKQNKLGGKRKGENMSEGRASIHAPPLSTLFFGATELYILQNLSFFGAQHTFRFKLKIQISRC
jgi:hypothetical protein